MAWPRISAAARSRGSGLGAPAPFRIHCRPIGVRALAFRRRAVGLRRQGEQTIDSRTGTCGGFPKTLDTLAGGNAGERVELFRGELRELAVRLENGMSPSDPSRAVEGLLLEPLA